MMRAFVVTLAGAIGGAALAVAIILVHGAERAGTDQRPANADPI